MRNVLRATFNGLTIPLPPPPLVGPQPTDAVESNAAPTAGGGLALTFDALPDPTHAYPALITLVYTGAAFDPTLTGDQILASATPRGTVSPDPTKLPGVVTVDPPAGLNQGQPYVGTLVYSYEI